MTVNMLMSGHVDKKLKKETFLYLTSRLTTRGLAKLSRYLNSEKPHVVLIHEELCGWRLF